MPVLLVIPARYASSRFPGKPLASLRGAGGQVRSLVQRSWDAARGVRGVDRIVVATDDTRIQSACESFGAEVIMTSESCRNGTERCAEVSKLLPAYDTVVNFQGDAPLTPPWFVEAALSALAGSTVAVATPVLRCNAMALESLLQDRRHGRVGATTAVFDTLGRALYFSKEVLPFGAHQPVDGLDIPVFHHVGVYAYSAGILRDYARWPEGVLERHEGLEQLRFLENGAPVQTVQVNSSGHEFWELNNPDDLARIEKILAVQGIP